jgi:hypothetical protein
MSIFDTELEGSVRKVLDILPPRTRKIVERRYGLFGNAPSTLEAIGRKEGVTRERVRQIENDSLKRVRAHDSFHILDSAFKKLEQLFDAKGGVLSEPHLSDEEYFGTPQTQQLAVFLLELADFAERAKETPYFYARWYHKRLPRSQFEKALTQFADQLETKDGPALSESDFFDGMKRVLEKAGLSAKASQLRSYFTVLRPVEKNAWGEYGHITSPIVKPRGMKDEAYVALSKSKKPLHFTEIAERISGATERDVHVQTVHNELIKDDRFVLVGRGLYALRDWGYKPGFVKDVIIEILRGGPKDEDTIVQAVCNSRFVKRSTVRTNLQNKDLFAQNDDGSFTLVS